MQTLTREQILEDYKIKQKVLRKLFAVFQNEMKKIEDEQQKILMAMIELKKNNE